MKPFTDIQIENSENISDKDLIVSRLNKLHENNNQIMISLDDFIILLDADRTSVRGSPATFNFFEPITDRHILMTGLYGYWGKNAMKLFVGSKKYGIQPGHYLDEETLIKLEMLK